MDIKWKDVRRVLVIRLRSIGDTVLATPSLLALRRFLPDARIDILLESWVAPLLDGFDAVDNVIRVSKTAAGRLAAARGIRRMRYDVVFNLHGGPTSAFLTRASGAPHRVGYRNYRYAGFYNHLLSASADFWCRKKTHSAEQQLALLGFVGVPVADRPKSRLPVVEEADKSVEAKLADSVIEDPRSDFALLHPATAFYTKQWPPENFARTAEFLADRGIASVAVASRSENAVLDALRAEARVPIAAFDDLSLPEVAALASKAKLFVGNDSGIAHIAAAVGTPSVVIFGSSNRGHWHPWTDAPYQVIFEEFACQPCPGYTCEVYGDPKCILSVPVERVRSSIERLLDQASR
jgi:lipopolysaccharide heptosyltransferase II